LTIFKSILSPDLISELKNLDRSLIEEIQENSELKKQISDDIIKYFNKITDNVKTNYETLNYVSPILKSQIQNSVVEKLNDKQIEDAMFKSFAYNKFIKDFEAMIVFYGDPAQYKTALDFFKRDSGIASTGRFPLNDKIAIMKVKQMKHAYAQTLQSPFYFDGTFSSAVFKDQKLKSLYYDLYHKIFTKHYQSMGLKGNALKNKVNEELEAYLSMEVGDGQGWITFDSYRVYQTLLGRWSDPQEDLYQRIVAGEKIDPGIVAEFFPPKKVQYWGPLRKDGLPVRAFHKLSLMPLVPNVIEGTALQDLHENMVKQNINYGLFKSGSKLGTITDQNGNIDEVFMDQELDEIKPFDFNKPYTKNIVYLDFLKDQLDISTKFKGKVTFSTQLRKLAELGLWNNGVPADVEMNKETWDKLSEKDKKYESLYYRLTVEYEGLLEELMSAKRNELLEEAGWKMVNERYTGDITTLLNKVILPNLERGDLSNAELRSLKTNIRGELIFPLGMNMSAGRIEKLLYSAVNRTLVRQKTKGDMNVQISNSMFGYKDQMSKYRKATKQEQEKYKGTIDLPSYLPNSLDLIYPNENPVDIGARFKKDQTKANYANKIIGFGAENTSTKKYADAFGNNANTGDYNSTDIVMISVNGKGRTNQKENVKKTIEEINLAIYGGKVKLFIADNIKTANSSHNKTGEGVIAKHLEISGYRYTEKDGVGFWTSTDSSVVGDFNTTSAMKVKVALKGDFIKLLKLKHLDGEVIGDIDRLNDMIKDDAWLDKKDNRKMITMVAVRIPVQALNSSEFMEVYHFLPENAGSIIIPPAEIVAKSGSDFDIDKLTIMEPSLMIKNGELILNNEGVKGIENKLMFKIKDILSMPDNFIRLIRPNSNKLGKTIADDLAPIGRDRSSHIKILDPMFNVDMHEAFNLAGQALSIGAIDNTYNPLYNRSGMYLNNMYNYFGNDFPTRILFDHNVINMNNNEYISLGAIVNKNGNDIDQVLEQLINGWVDAESDLWIFDLNARKELASVFLLLVQAGVSLEEAALFLNNPLVKAYVNEKTIVASPFSLPSGRSSYLDYPAPQALNHVIKKYFTEGDVYKVGVFSQGETNITKTMAIKSAISERTDDFSYEELQEISEDNLTPTELQMRAFLHFIELDLYASSISETKNGTNLDTSPVETIYEADERDEKLNKVFANGLIPSGPIDDIINHSPISSFQDIPEFQQQIWQAFFPKRQNKDLDEYLYNYLQTQTGKAHLNSTFGDKNQDKFISAFKNAITDFIFQNHVINADINSKTYKSLNLNASNYLKIKDVRLLRHGAFVKEGVLYVDRKSLRKIYKEELFASEKERVRWSGDNIVGSSLISASAFKSRGFSSENSFIRYTYEKEYLRYIMPYDSISTTKEFEERLKKNMNIIDSVETKREEGETDKKYEKRMKYLTYDEIITNKALDNTLNIWKMFYSSESMANQWSEIKKKYGEELGLTYDLINEILPDIRIKGNIKNLKLKDRILSDDDVNTYNENLMELSDPGVDKVKDKEANNLISDFFNRLSFFAMIQSGIGTVNEFSMTRIINQEEVMMSFVSAYKNFEINENNLNIIMSRFVRQNRASDRSLNIRLKNYMISATSNIEGENIPVQSPTGVQTISEDYGVVQVETNPTNQEKEKDVELIKSQIQNQSFKENVGRYANEMFHYGLRWGRKNYNFFVKDENGNYVRTTLENEGEQLYSRRRNGSYVKSSRTDKAAYNNGLLNPADIDSFAGKGDMYGYDFVDQNGNPLPPIADLQPIIDKIEQTTGIDMTDYDSVIGNIYLPGEYVYPHKDTTESKSAKGYPVIVYTIGNDAGLGIVDNNKGKMTFANEYDTQYLPQQDKLKGYTNELKTKHGSIYTFGLDGKGRFELTHSTPVNSQKNVAQPAITLPNGKTVTNYTITLTFRRAANLEEGMSSKPARTKLGRTKSTSEVKGEKLIFNDDINSFKGYIEKSKGEYPESFFTSKTKFKVFYNSNTGKREGAPQTSKWILQKNKKYDLIDLETGEVFITNVDLLTGYQHAKTSSPDKDGIQLEKYSENIYFFDKYYDVQHNNNVTFIYEKGSTSRDNTYKLDVSDMKDETIDDNMIEIDQMIKDIKDNINTDNPIALYKPGYFQENIKENPKTFIYLSKKLLELDGFINPGSELSKSLRAIIQKDQIVTDKEIEELKNKCLI